MTKENSSVKVVENERVTTRQRLRRLAGDAALPTVALATGIFLWPSPLGLILTGAGAIGDYNAVRRSF